MPSSSPSGIVSQRCSLLRRMLRWASLRYLLVTLIAVLSLNALLLWQGYPFTTSSTLPLTNTLSGARLAHYVTQRPNAVIYALVRNSELGSLLQTIQDMEHNFNAHPDTRYPYVGSMAYAGFLNDEPFTDRFKRHVSAATQSPVYYGLVPKEQWEVPASVNLSYAKTVWESLRNQHVAYADSQSYRQMCRYQSGYFMNHALMKPFDYYWRIEPGVSYFCKMFDSDPFRVMRDQNKKYGWVITLRDDPRTLPTLWNRAMEFRQKYPEYARNTSMLPFFLSKRKQYNTCHFWSSTQHATYADFEIADLRWMRSDAYQTFFRFLSDTNGFFYERWGDAPVHSLAVGLFLNQSDVHYFENIGYEHHPFRHCPVAKPGRCACMPEDSLSTEYSGSGQNCLYLWNKLQGESFYAAYERLRLEALNT